MRTQWLAIALVVLTLLPATATAQTAPSSPCNDQYCVVTDIPSSISYKRVPFTGSGTDVGKYRSVNCDPALEVVADRYLTRGTGSDTTEYYSGSFCFPLGGIPGDTAITSALLMEPIDLPGIRVDHNPHADTFITNLPTWFWHSGPTTHTQTATYDVDSLTQLTGRYEGRILTYCWTVDDTRAELPARELGGQACDTPAGATTYVNDVPGTDSAEGAAATHTYTTRSYTSGITHEVVWVGTVTITGGPQDLVGQVFQLQPTVVRARTDVPVRQIIPVLVPGQEQ